MNQQLQAPERSLRSVFVGNIPYDASEEKLRDIFSAVGPVLSFRIVFDRDTGKPKGYGFCEYKDQETATSAIRNLNGHDLGGRQLRVDSASNEKARDEPEQNNAPSHDQMQLQMQHPIIQAPETMIDAETQINNVIRGTQPEMLFEICKQTKCSLLVNPNETRHLLLQNPQLCYTLLQALVAIKAIDQQASVNFLHKPLMQPAQLQQPMQMYPTMAPIPTNPAAAAGLSGPLGASPMVLQSQPMAGYSAAFIGSQPMAGPTLQPNSAAPSQQPVVALPQPVVSAPSVVPNDPRLARQQQQQQQHKQQQQQHQQQQQIPQQPSQPMSDEEKQVWQMIYTMTEQQIATLPPEQQHKIYLLREHMSGGNPNSMQQQQR